MRERYNSKSRMDPLGCMLIIRGKVSLWISFGRAKITKYIFKKKMLRLNYLLATQNFSELFCTNCCCTNGNYNASKTTGVKPFISSVSTDDIVLRFYFRRNSLRTNSLFAIYLQILHPDKPHPSSQCMEFKSGIWELVSLRNLTGSPDTHLTKLTMRQNKVSAKSFDVGKENSQE